HGRVRVVGEPTEDSAMTPSGVAVAARRREGQQPTGGGSGHPEQHVDAPTPEVGQAVGDGEAQVAQLTIRDGYHPDVVHLAPGVPVRLNVVRQEQGACSERFVVPDLGVDVAVPAFGGTTVQLPALAQGRYEVTCGMGMLHGALEV